MALNTQNLKRWFLNSRRDLPWRNNPSPYQVWVSEVMLQQTQVSVVIPYFERWMNRFPTIEALANAPLDDVIKIWEGLGYYSRARNLHAGAKTVLERFNGRIPENEQDLASIKGLGPYTIGAIRSFAFKKKAAALDGNVIRVLCRYFGIVEDVTKSKTIKHLNQIALSVLPDHEPWIVAEALIELGATICSKKALCSSCPLASECQALKNGTVLSLPFKPKRVKTTKLLRRVAVIEHQEHVLIRKAGQNEIMADLHEFPYFEITDPIAASVPIERRVKDLLRIDTHIVHDLPTEKHSFTRYRVTLEPTLLRTAHREDIEGHIWIGKDAISSLPFSSGHRRVLNSLLKLCKA